MERKIGEIFELKGEWYQCAEGTGCYKCDFNFNEDTCVAENPHCTCRSDHRNVVYKKLEKVGEPYAEGNSIVSERMFQKYRTYEKNFFLNERDLLFTSYGDIVSIEIKQNQEDMEEKKLNLKPFDLKKAKEGKPVCTRDGRKARIICWDRYASCYHIVALIECKGFPNKEEEVKVYTDNGKCISGEENAYDLMMLPEKKEGWVNVYKERIYSTKEEAIEATYDGVT